MKWLCFRALVEVLLGTGMRISEALSLKRSSINFHGLLLSSMVDEIAILD